MDEGSWTQNALVFSEQELLEYSLECYSSASASAPPSDLIAECDRRLQWWWEQPKAARRTKKDVKDLQQV